eukprot:CAMPEP_0202374818 /NCGR_PEP_ID=MMETSP1127-20130417/5580_1 /ASSEMBLY_ACC=CAM_ASM_000462 /TAXON_ID=3047 /ORGANISM="Dunaliella tertiolecta, Strain CCMP1320" /LENGTH=153 /DNA_ID=CAMNT_0048972085 /DNA_START=1035 /DNA_END=1496 /DNA_ORIENTATION=-
MPDRTPDQQTMHHPQCCNGGRPLPPGLLLCQELGRAACKQLRVLPGHKMPKVRKWAVAAAAQHRRWCDLRSHRPAVDASAAAAAAAADDLFAAAGAAVQDALDPLSSVNTQSGQTGGSQLHTAGAQRLPALERGTAAVAAADALAPGRAAAHF